MLLLIRPQELCVRPTKVVPLTTCQRTRFYKGALFFFQQLYLDRNLNSSQHPFSRSFLDPYFSSFQETEIFLLFLTSLLFLSLNRPPINKYRTQCYFWSFHTVDNVNFIIEKFSSIILVFVSHSSWSLDQQFCTARSNSRNNL